MTQLSLFNVDAPVLIGLGDRARVGKDTVGQILVDRGFVRVSYADGVRDAALLIDPYVGAQEVRLSQLIDALGFEGVKETPWGDEVRRLLQRIGTEVGREMISETVWTDLAERKIVSHLAEGKSVVVTDCRFNSEAVHIRSLGGEVWRLNRLSAVSIGTHASESGIDPELVDREISNNGTIADLSNTVVAILDRALAA